MLDGGRCDRSTRGFISAFGLRTKDVAFRNKPLRGGLYARVSTADQSADLQLDGLRRLAEQRGWVITGEFVDHGISGAKDRRPELDKLMAAVHKGKLDVVACWRFDRFARSVRHLVLALDEFRAKGIDFVSMNDGIDTSTPAGRFSFTIIAAVAELERELIRERTRAGVQAARRRGARLGRPKIDFDLDAAVRLRAEGQSIREVARALGVNPTTLHRGLAAVSESSPAVG
ncbi:MAG: recombinase family protein [Myxococcales bacterium]|nr:recombinase family protein [Myxococcales bacterium]